METFQNLHVLITPERKEYFFKEIIENIHKSKWKYREDIISNYRKNTFTKAKLVLCVESEVYMFENQAFGGLLWMWDYSGYFEVFNIVPTMSNMLSHSQYNTILDKFYKLFIAPIVDKYDAEVTISKPEKLIIETIGDDAYNSLKAFSGGANKSTGNTHPYDFDRWCDFVFIIFRKKINLSVDELINWLLEDGWDDEMASKLGIEFEYSIDLLSKYEQNN